MDAALSLPGSYLVLEVSSLCPLRCGHCAASEAESGHPHYQGARHIEPGMVRELMQDLRSSGLRFDDLVLFWLGEPLSNPGFEAIYRTVLEHSGRGELFGKIEVHTNGFPLSRRIARAACNDLPVPQVWHLTMDAIRPETFAAIKGRDAFEKSQRQALALVRAKGEARTRWPRLAVQFIVSDVNVGEAEEFASFWTREFGEAGLPVATTGFHVPAEGPTDFIYLKALDCPTPEEQDRQNRVYAALMARLGLRSPVDPDAARRVGHDVDRELRVPCSGFFKSPTIGADGRVTVCTRDNAFHLAVGSLAERSFSRIWLETPLLNRRRQLVGRGDYCELPFCRTCFIPSSVNYSGITREEVQAFLRAAGLEGGLVAGVEPCRHARPWPDSWEGRKVDQVYEDRVGRREPDDRRSLPAGSGRRA